MHSIGPSPLILDLDHDVLLSDRLRKQNLGPDALSPNPWARPDGRIRDEPPLAIMEAQERAQQRAQDRALDRERLWNQEQGLLQTEERERPSPLGSHKASPRPHATPFMTRGLSKQDSVRERPSTTRQRTPHDEEYGMLQAGGSGRQTASRASRDGNLGTAWRASKAKTPVYADLSVDSSSSSSSSSSSWGGSQRSDSDADEQLASMPAPETDRIRNPRKRSYLQEKANNEAKAGAYSGSSSGRGRAGASGGCRTGLPDEDPPGRRDRAFSFETGDDVASREAAIQRPADWNLSDEDPAAGRANVDRGSPTRRARCSRWGEMDPSGKKRSPGELRASSGSKAADGGWHGHNRKYHDQKRLVSTRPAFGQNEAGSAATGDALAPSRFRNGAGGDLRPQAGGFTPDSAVGRGTGSAPFLGDARIAATQALAQKPRCSPPRPPKTDK